MTAKTLYTAIIVTVPDDDYAHASIIGITEEKAKALEISVDAAETERFNGSSDGIYLVITDIPKEAYILPGTPHADTSVYVYDEEKEAFILALEAGNGRNEQHEGYDCGTEEAFSTALSLFGWA